MDNNKFLILVGYFCDLTGETSMFNVPTKKELEKIPKLFSNENEPFKDKIIHMHFFLLNSDWYIAEFDGEDIFFGFVCLNGWKGFAEWGNISFSELKKLKAKVPIKIYGIDSGSIPLEVDRDLFFKPKKAIQIKLINECQGW